MASLPPASASKQSSRHALPNAIRWSQGEGPGVVAFLHQKGGVGKSILSIATSILLSQGGCKVALLDADPQGASSTWGTLHGQRWQVEVSAVGAPIASRALAPFSQHDWVVIDSPPGLSEMSVSICTCAHLVITPLRAAWPDVWALSWLGALLQKQARQGRPCIWRAIFNQASVAEGLEYTTEIARVGADLHPKTLPWCAQWPKVFSGEPPPSQAQELLVLLER